MNDLEISHAISPDIGDDYKTALEFVNSNPEYSLLKFREITSAVVEMIAKKNEIVFVSEKLFDKINQLFSCQLISHPLKEQLHEARILGNEGVHVKLTFEGATEFRELRKKGLIDSAHKARKLVVSVFEDVMEQVVGRKNIGKAQLSPVGQQEYREILYEASISENAKLKLKAGVLCETIFNEQKFQHGIALTSDSSAHLENLRKNAINFYEAGCKISANIDSFLLSSGGAALDEEQVIQREANVESLFRFGSLCIYEEIPSDQYDLGMARLKAAAERGYGPSEALFGAMLYEKREYEESLKHLDSAAEKDEVLALRFLFILYSEGAAYQNNTRKAIDYLDRAVDLGCPDSIAMKGEAYHKGEVVEKDDELAKSLLEKSIDMGSEYGKHYFVVEFNDLAGQITDQFKGIGEAIQQLIERGKNKPFISDAKIGRNEPCFCGSGKKYKKCCGVR